MDRPSILSLRSAVLRAIRGFFFSRDYIEVETPVRLAAPALEEHIDAIPAEGQYLRTSPELHLKRLLSEGFPRLFELGPCFRKDERGALHNPEFTMLEWYRTEAGYEDILEETRELLCHVAATVLGASRFEYDGHSVELDAAWEVLTVRDAFRQHAGWDPVADPDPDRFDIDLVTRVEPALERTRPAVLKDYPAALGALARLKPEDPSVAERWELYVAGIELANAFGELVDAGEQRERFRQCAGKRRAAGKEVYPLDEEFLKALARGLPPCAGIALGVDRLVMLLSGARNIAQVRAF
jgi:elongation factor P--(R)-beta-lysine ligase